MKQLIIYSHDPHVIKHWKGIKDYSLKQCNDLKRLNLQTPLPGTIVLMHLTTEEKQLPQMKALAEQGFNIIAFSNTPTSQEGVNLFKIGIKGYLNTFSTAVIIQQSIEAVTNGNVWLGQLVLNAMILNLSQKTPPSQKWKILLTKREIEAATEILQGKNNREIAFTLNITERTVKSYVHKLFEKFDAKDRLDLVLKIQNWK